MFSPIAGTMQNELRLWPVQGSTLLALPKPFSDWRRCNKLYSGTRGLSRDSEANLNAVPSSSREDWLVEPNANVATYKDDAVITIAWDLDGVSDFEMEWAEKFPGLSRIGQFMRCVCGIELSS